MSLNARQKQEFLIGLKRNLALHYCANMLAGVPLSVVYDERDTDLEFAALWDKIRPLEGSERQLSPTTLEQVLWSQCSDEEAAAYFYMSVDEFKEAIEADEELKKIHDIGRLGGQAALKISQKDSALGGKETMQIHLGKQYLGQDSGATHNPGTMIVNFNVQNPGDSYRRLLYGGTLAPIDGEVIKEEQKS